jgi:hypothetical protein
MVFILKGGGGWPRIHPACLLHQKTARMPQASNV